MAEPVRAHPPRGAPRAQTPTVDDRFTTMNEIGVGHPAIFTSCKIDVERPGIEGA